MGRRTKRKLTKHSRSIYSHEGEGLEPRGWAFHGVLACEIPGAGSGLPCHKSGVGVMLRAIDHFSVQMVALYNGVRADECLDGVHA